MDSYCVYILKGDRFYIGSTNNLERRLKEHIIKGYSSMRIGNRICIGYIPCETLQEARTVERSIKKSGHYERRINKNSNNIVPLHSVVVQLGLLPNWSGVELRS